MSIVLADVFIQQSGNQAYWEALEQAAYCKHVGNQETMKHFLDAADVLRIRGYAKHPKKTERTT